MILALVFSTPLTSFLSFFSFLLPLPHIQTRSRHRPYSRSRRLHTRTSPSNSDQHTLHSTGTTVKAAPQNTGLRQGGDGRIVSSGNRIPTNATTTLTPANTVT